MPRAGSWKHIEEPFCMSRGELIKRLFFLTTICLAVILAIGYLLTYMDFEISSKDKSATLIISLGALALIVLIVVTARKLGFLGKVK